MRQTRFRCSSVENAPPVAEMWEQIEMVGKFLIICYHFDVA